MRTTRWIGAALLPLTLGALLTSVQAQGKGYGAERKAAKSQSATKQDKQEKQAKESKGVARGNVRGAERPEKLQANPGSARGRAARELAGGNAAVKGNKSNTVLEAGGSVERPGFRVLAASDKKGRRLAGQAIARAHKRGVSEDDFIITPEVQRVLVLNRAGVLLVDLDNDREVGNWRAITERDRDVKGAPSFCRSGEGHPVWGRQWCIDKGFGLGEFQEVRWARVINPGNVVLRRTTTGPLSRDVLLDVLGDVVFNRLATQAITLGYVDPLTGRWIGEPTGGPRVLLLTAGDRPIAEIVDVNHDDRADLLVVAVRP
ncbi:MAG: hypothetical protein WD825_13245 [Gemmatimonadaceae bacterium]